jgi:hypothetical protein
VVGLDPVVGKQTLGFGDQSLVLVAHTRFVDYLYMALEAFT